MDSCLTTTGVQGFALHRPTSSVFVRVSSLADVDIVCGLRIVPPSADSDVPKQAYLTSSSDLIWYMVSGVDSNEPPESLVVTLTRSILTVLQARYMGSGCTCLVTLEGASTPLTGMNYYGCILQLRFTVSRWCIATDALIGNLRKPLPIHLRFFNGISKYPHVLLRLLSGGQSRCHV